MATVRLVSAKSASSRQKLKDTNVPDEDSPQEDKDQNQNEATQSKNLLQKKYSKPAYLQSLNESEKAQNFKIIERMNKRVNYQKNPRFKVNKAPIRLNQDAQGQPTDTANPWSVEPKVVLFVDYQVNGVYEIPLKVTNKSKVGQRMKYLPPGTEHFTIKKVIYPSDKESMVAPGMSITLQVSFCAPSFADFDDQVTLITEENSFIVPVRARREPPVINLVNPMDCQSCWIGERVDMAFRCMNSGGDGGFKFFCERDEDDNKQIDPDTIHIGPFTLYPSEFYLYSGNAVDIFVSFNPEYEGTLTENLILACDNQTSEFYKLSGFGAMLDLDVVAVDSKVVDFHKNPFSTIFFENTNPTSEAKRVVTYKNKSPIAVAYHWSIYKSKNTNKITLQDEPTHYKVEPSQGKIPAGETIDFNFIFCPLHAEPYYEYADLIIEDIPINSMRNPPEGLRNFAEKTEKSRIPMPTYVGSNTQYLAVPLMQFNMRGQGNYCEVEMNPPILYFEGDLFINKDYKKKVQMKKKSEGIVDFKMKMTDKSCQNFQVLIRDSKGNTFDTETGLMTGQINEESHLDMEVQIRANGDCCGKQFASFVIEIENGMPLAFKLEANFVGPKVVVLEPVVDFGLLKINSSHKFRLNLQNTSPIETRVLIKNSKNKKLSLKDFDEATVSSSNPSYNKSQTRGFGREQHNQFSITPQFQVLKPHQKTSVVISLECLKEETIQEYLEIIVEHQTQGSQFVSLNAEIQKPYVSLNHHVLNMGKIFAGVEEVIDEQHEKCLVLKNYGNLPALFHWEEKADEDRIIAYFEPARGTIPPKGEIMIKCRYTVYQGGLLNEIFLCEIQDVEFPLGFELKGDVFGLSVSYEVTDEEMAELNKTQAMTGMNQTRQSITQGASDPMNAMLPGSVYSAQDRDTFSATQMTALQGAGGKDDLKRLRRLNFPNCHINKPCTQKFILKNLSGIKTTFDFSSFNFEPPEAAYQNYRQMQEKNKQAQQQAAIEQASQPQSRQSKNGTANGRRVEFALSAKSGSRKAIAGTQKKKAEFKLNRPLLTDEHEATNKFSSATGETFTATKKLEREQAFYLSNNKGIAVVFNPPFGELLPNAEIPISVTVYNNVCGKFDDHIISQIRGLQQMQFPVSIAISGSPIVVPPSQVGLNYKTSPPTMAMPTLTKDAPKMSKRFKIKNTGIKDVTIQWDMFDKDLSAKEEKKDYFDLKILKNQGFDSKEMPFKIDLTAIEPEPSYNSAFQIDPPQCVVPARKFQEFDIYFDATKGLGQFKSVVLAHPQLVEDEETEGTPAQNLGVISLFLEAVTLEPQLSIDRKVRMDGENYLNFYIWSTPNGPDPVQKFTFNNETKADMTFNISLSGPFEFVKTKSNTGALHPLATTAPSKSVVKQKANTMFCLQPNKIVEINLRYKHPNRESQDDWPNIMQVIQQGQLIITYANGREQKLNLRGILQRPKLQLLAEKPAKNEKSQDEMDFGIVNIDHFRRITFFLSNITPVTANWSLNYVKFPQKQTIGYKTKTPMEIENLEMNDDPDVFEFSVTDGTLKGKSTSLRIVPEGLALPAAPASDEEKMFLPQKVMVNFRPKKNILYKSKFRFVVEGGMSCDVILKGRGTYEEDFDED